MKIKITHHPIKTLVTAALLIVSLVGVVGWHLARDVSHAADIKNFDPGNIMSDSVMSNKDSMSVQDIQNFLNSKNYCDNKDTYKAAWYPHLQYSIKDGRFVCMARDSFNGKSAAQIIWQVGQDYNINPQFLIVLLEKEQGLVSDTWPNSRQYQTATGFGCPDTAPCDSQYFGLENQLRQAANLFRNVLNGGWSNYPIGNTYVQYHPNASCGGSVINIQNRATSALYRYTPYQPNQSALSAGYGTGDSCGAYGNRNTWRLFTDWFGSTIGINPIENAIYRLWNSVTNTHFMTADISEARRYVANGWTYDKPSSYLSDEGKAVYRLYNKSSRSHFFTADTGEVSAYVKAGWINDGVVFKSPNSGKAVYRLYNKSSRSHFYTSSIDELENYLGAGWSYDRISYYSNETTKEGEVNRLYNKSTQSHILVSTPAELGAYMGAGWINDGVVFKSPNSGKAVYRLYNKSSRSHFFTADANEVSAYVKAGWINDGVVFKSPNSGKAVYRLYNKFSRSHFFTADANEVSAYVKAGWINDGVVFYGDISVYVGRIHSETNKSYRLKTLDSENNAIIKGLQSGGTPVFELFNGNTGSYFYTINTNERSVYLSAGWVDKGVLFNSPESGISVYRLYSPTTQKHIITSTQTELNDLTANGWINDGVVFYGNI